MPTYSAECEHLIFKLKQILPNLGADKALAALMARLILLLDARLTELEEGTTISGPAV
jgi:hypothetical protein